MNKVLFAAVVVLFIGSVSAQEFSKSDYEKGAKNKKVFLEQRLHDIHQQMVDNRKFNSSTILSGGLIISGISCMIVSTLYQTKSTNANDPMAQASKMIFDIGFVSVGSGIAIVCGSGMVSDSQYRILLYSYDNYTKEIIKLDV